MLNAWIDLQRRSASQPAGSHQRRRSCASSRPVPRLLREAVRQEPGTEAPRLVRRGAPVRDLLGSISQSRPGKASRAVETATFVFSLKEPLFARLRRSCR